MLILYHGTDYDNAVKICNEKQTNQTGLWCTNNVQDALKYGKHLVCIHIPEDSWGLKKYLSDTGEQIDMSRWPKEPLDFHIRENVSIECNLVE